MLSGKLFYHAHFILQLQIKEMLARLAGTSNADSGFPTSGLIRVTLLVLHDGEISKK